MRLCIVASGDFYSEYGGGQVYVRNITDSFIKHKSELNIELFILSIASAVSKSISQKEYNGIDIYETKLNGDIKKIIREIAPDVIHANGEKLLIAKICKELNIPCVVTVHHGGIVCPAGALLNTNDEICRIPADYSHCLKCYLRNTPTGLFWYPLLKNYSQKQYCRIGERLKKLPSVPFLSPIGQTGQIVTNKLKDWKELAATASHFIAPSNAISEALKRNGCPSDKITVIPHGIPIHQTTNSKHQTLDIHFYYVGRINYVKGIHVLLEAFSSIENPNIILHLIGGAGNKSEQKYQNQLKRKYSKDTRIVWHGKIPYEQIDILTKEFHCLIHPAICLEVFGLDIAEALQQHKYVIATRCGGAEMQIHNEKDGSLVEANDIISLKNAIVQFIKHPRRSSALVQSIEDHIKQLMLVYARQL